jgi:SAM-dependent methyltransferase
MPSVHQALFALDTPEVKPHCELTSPFRISGWIIPVPENPLQKVEVEINGQVRSRLSISLRRPDVGAVFPNMRGSLWSGFLGEVFLDDLLGKEIEFAVIAHFLNDKQTVARFPGKIERRAREISPRPRSWSISSLLACPLCLSSLSEQLNSLLCASCGNVFELRRGTPVFNTPGDLVETRLLEQHPTNPNGGEHDEIISRFKDGIVLDFGAGNPREADHYPNVLFHDFVQYAHTDVVSVCDRLPYREGVFDAVISKATFEHLKRPWEIADEIYRVLKPGGLLHVDTAFMQPLHADPYHFFNMTLDGAKEIFKRFQVLNCGVKSYQAPSWGLRMQFDVILDHLQAEPWRSKFQQLRDSLTTDFDEALEERGREKLAAGVFFEGIKPLS